MKGFFELPEKKVRTKARGIPAGTPLGCSVCRLDKTCRSPRMGVTGNGRLGVLIIAEAPGELEDYKGTQLIGPASQCLRRTLSKLNVNLDEDCWKINAVNCRPVNNQTPEEIHFKSCWKEMVLPAIKELNPTTIILLGGTAINQWMGEFWPEKVSISTMRGYCIPDHDLSAWVCPTYHPSYIMRQGMGKNGHVGVENVAEVIWSQDLENAFRDSEALPEKLGEGNSLNIVSESEAIKWMDVLKVGLLEFDYETTGLKPQKRGHRIVCCSICFQDNDAFSFEMTPKTAEALKKLLSNSNIGKMAHNIKFEDIWTNVILGCPVENWHWDSMIAAHLDDNRAGTKGLDFQGLVHFGVKDYCSEISPFLKGKDEKDANSFNRITEVPIEKLMKYNAMDSLIGYNLAMMQMKGVK